MEIKSAEEILNKWDLSKINNHRGYGINHIEAMKEYASQFIDLATEEAQKDFDKHYEEFGWARINKESILKVKQLIK